MRQEAAGPGVAPLWLFKPYWPGFFVDRGEVNDIHKHAQIRCFFGVDRNIARRHADSGLMLQNGWSLGDASGNNRADGPNWSVNFQLAFLFGAPN